MSTKSAEPKLKLYTEDDMVAATFAGEEVQIPKAWIGTEYADGYALASKDDRVVEIPDGDPTDTWIVKEIEAYASREGIDLPKEAKSKADKLAVILEAKTAPTTPAD